MATPEHIFGCHNLGKVQLVRDADKPPTVHRTAPQTIYILWPKMSILSKLRKPILELDSYSYSDSSITVILGRLTPHSMLTT